MQKELLPKVEQFAKQNKRRSIWKKFVRVMACVVVFCTTYALILPALTLERTNCVLGEHIHSDSCYIKQTSRQQTRLVCSYEVLEIHTHTEQCYDASQKLECGRADFVLHEHDVSCHDENGVLVCVLPEIREHWHGEDCYQMPQIEEHIHEDTCYEQITELTCLLEETESAEPIQICGKEEIQRHTHQEDSCYGICTDENGSAQKRLVCEKTAVEVHIHDDGCFITELVPMEDLDTLTCTLEEDESHTHTDRCYGTWELICGKEEHTHTTVCEDLSGPVGYAYQDTSPMMFMAPRAVDSKTYHTNIEPLLARIIIIDSKDNLVYDSDDPSGNTNTVHVGEECRIILYFKENTTNQFATDGTGVLTYQIPANLSSDIVDSGTINNRDHQKVATYTINQNELVITPVLINGENFFGEFNDVTLEIELDAEVIHSEDFDYTEIKFDNNHKVDILVQEDGTLIPKKKQLHYDQATQTITYECTVTAHGGTVFLDFLDDWWWPDNFTFLQDSIQLTDSQGNDITQGWTYGESGTYFKLIPQSPITLKHGEYITLIYQIQLKDGINYNFEFSNTFAVHGRFGEGELYAKSTANGFIEFTNVEKTGIYIPLGENGTVQNALEWIVNIDNSDLNQITITDRLGPGQTYCEHKPLYIYGIRTDGTGQEFSVAWEDVDRNEANNQFTLPLPTEDLGEGEYEFAEYMLIYYSHYTLEENGPDVQYFENSVETNIMIGNKPTSDEASVGVLGVPPNILKEVTAADDEWLTFTVECFMPVGLNNRTAVLLYDTLASWSDNFPGYIQQIPDSLTVTVTPEGGAPYTLLPYENQESADNTYLLNLDGQSFTMYFNTSEASADTSTWKCDGNSTLTITYRVSLDAPMLDKWGGTPNGETLRQFLARTGQNVNNDVQLNYSPTDKVKDTAVWTPPKVPDPHLRKTAAATQEDGVYHYSVWLDAGDPDECIFKGVSYQTEDGEWHEKNDILSLTLTDTFDARMEYVPGTLKVTVRDAWDHNKILQVYQLPNGNAPHITSNENISTMVVSATDLMASAEYEQWLANRSLLYAIEQLRGGYQYEFTYQLRVKQEVKDFTTEGVLQLDNTAALDWTDSTGPQTVDPAQNRVFYDTGILQKGMTPIANSNLVRFTILVNHNALDLAADGDTYILTDTMSSNLALLYNTLAIEVLNEETGEVEGVLTTADCLFTYDPDQNKMTLALPDNRMIRISYNCVIHGIGGQTVQINNTVEVEGRSALQDVVESQFQILDHQGSADGSSESFYLQKQDGNNHKVLAGVTFHLYSDVKSNAYSEAIVVDGKTFYFCKSYTTGSNGIVHISHSQLTSGHLYILKEDSPPEGFVALEEPFMFYMEERPPGGSMEIPCVVDGELVVIQNYPIGYELPATGGAGTTLYALGGALLIMAVTILLYSQSSKGRKEDKPSF